MKKKNSVSAVSVLLLICICIMGKSQTCPVSFLPKTDYSASTGANGIASADFDGDGNTDLVFLQSGLIHLMPGSATGTFSPATTFTAGNGPNDLIAVDLDEDGDQDLVVANFLSNDLSVLLGNGSGGFDTAVNYTVASGPRHLASADFNNDSIPDIVVSATNVSSVTVLIGAGNGTFGADTTFAVGSQPEGVAAADFNNDGNIDIVSANQSGDNVSLLLGAGTGSFATAVDFIVSADPRKITCGDFNGDGNMDVATANFASPQVSVLLGTGTGSFGAVTNYVSAIGAVCYGITSADFNNDGITDLAVANNGLSHVSVMSGNGAGSFATAGNFNVQNVPLALCQNDFNKDGKIDLAVTNAGANGGVSVLLNATSLPLVSVTTSDTSLCAGQTATLTAQGASTYVWNTGANTTGITVSPVISTSYTVSGTDTNFCTNTTIFTQVVSSCAGSSEEFYASGNFSVYPIPNNGNFTITFQVDAKTNYKLEIYNALGQVVFSKELQDFSGMYGEDVQVRVFGKGMYIVAVTGPKGRVTTKVMTY
jgi:hypothetical protein